MATTYGLITVAALELLLGGRDLETMDASYTDTEVEAILSFAEEQVIGLSGSTWTSTTITIPVTAALKTFAIFEMESVMIRDGHMETADRTVSRTTLNIFQQNMTALFEAARSTGSDVQGFYVIKGSGV